MRSIAYYALRANIGMAMRSLSRRPLLLLNAKCTMKSEAMDVRVDGKQDVLAKIRWRDLPGQPPQEPEWLSMSLLDDEFAAQVRADFFLDDKDAGSVEDAKDAEFTERDAAESKRERTSRRKKRPTSQPLHGGREFEEQMAAERLLSMKRGDGPASRSTVKNPLRVIIPRGRQKPASDRVDVKRCSEAIDKSDGVRDAIHASAQWTARQLEIQRLWDADAQLRIAAPRRPSGEQLVASVNEYMRRVSEPYVTRRVCAVCAELCFVRDGMFAVDLRISGTLCRLTWSMANWLQSWIRISSTRCGRC